MRSSPSIYAAAALSAGIFAFSLQDMIIKSISGDYPVHEAMVLRSLTALPLLLYLVHRAGGIGLLIFSGWRWLALRGIVMTCSYMSYYLAMPAMKLANVVALNFSSPIFITIMAVLVLGERPKLDRWSAVIVGALGAVVMLQPRGREFDWASLLPLVAALTYAVAQIMVRRLGLLAPASVMAFYQNLMFMIIALLAATVLGQGTFDFEHPTLKFLARAWIMPSTIDLLLMLACGVIAAIGMVLLTHAYRIAEASLVTPFEYTALIWGALWGYTIWGEVPSFQAVLGAALIIAAGLYMLWAEGRYRRAALQSMPPP